MSKDVEKVDVAPPVSYTAQEKEIIRKAIAPDLSELQFDFFMADAIRRGLDPLTKEIYAVKYGSKVVHQVGIDGHLRHAERTGKFRGFTEAELTVRDKDGNVKCVPHKLYDPESHKLVAATVGVRHADDSEPTYVTATIKEYAVFFGDKLSDRWAKAPATQIIKCAQAKAIRERFPMGGGVWSPEESEQARMSAQDYVDAEYKSGPTKTILNLEDVSPGNVLDHTPVDQPLKAPECVSIWEGFVKSEKLDQKAQDEILTALLADMDAPHPSFLADEQAQAFTQWLIGQKKGKKK